jgi:NADPH2:quinone reductase
MAPTIPSEMNAIEIPEPGGPEALKLGRRLVPEPASGEVLIKVKTAGVNRADTLQRMGLYPMPPGATDIPGLEASGEVVALGHGASRFKIGDEVCALLSGGGYAEYVNIPEPQCMALPPKVDLHAGGGVPETFCTVWTNVFERAGLKPGEVYLAQGGTSGIGYTGIQLAKAFGSPVLATAGSDEKARACEEFGADRGINYKTEDFVKVGMDFTEGRGVDVILDMVGGSYIQRQLEVLAREGRLCFVALMEGTKVEADFGLVHRKHLTVTGSTLRSRTVEQKGSICRALEAKVWPLFESGQCSPVIYKTFPLDQAAEAHALMESSQHIGKIMLET